MRGKVEMEHGFGADLCGAEIQVPQLAPMGGYPCSSWLCIQLKHKHAAASDEFLKEILLQFECTLSQCWGFDGTLLMQLLVLLGCYCCIIDNYTDTWCFVNM